jgi:RHS repeat-associated protein
VSGTLTNPLTYTAREFDSETGLSYNRARYYDPAAGRWLSEDPIRFFGGQDFYAYVLNSPLRYRDPFGQQGEVPDCFPDCVHSQEERAQMQNEQALRMLWIMEPDGPPRPKPQCSCEDRLRKIDEISKEMNDRNWEAIQKTLLISGSTNGAEWVAEHVGEHWVERLVPWVEFGDIVHVYYEIWENGNRAEEEPRGYDERCGK